MAVYVLTASSSKYPTKRWLNIGFSKYEIKNRLKNIPCKVIIKLLYRNPGFFILRKINKWNL